MKKHIQKSAELKPEMDIENFVKAISTLSVGKSRLKVMACLLKATVNAFTDNVEPDIINDDLDTTVIYQYYLSADQPIVVDGKLLFHISEEYAHSSPHYQKEQFFYLNGDTRSLKIIIDLNNMIGVIESVLEPSPLGDIRLWSDGEYKYVGIYLFGDFPTIIEQKNGSNWLRLYSNPFSFNYNLNLYIEKFQNHDPQMMASIAIERNRINAKIAIGDCKGTFDYSAIY